MNLVIKNLSKSFGNSQIFKNISYTFQPHNIYTLQEPSGSGKTTFLNILSGLDSEYTGNIKLIPAESSIENFYSKVSYMPQTPQIISELTVYEHLQATSYIYNQDITLALEYLKKLKMIDCLLKPAYQLSGGQAKRLSFIITASKEAACYIFDEPTTHLDSYNIKNMLAIIKEKQQKSIIIIASHNSDIQKIGTPVSLFKKV